MRGTACNAQGLKSFTQLPFVVRATICRCPRVFLKLPLRGRENRRGSLKEIKKEKKKRKKGRGEKFEIDDIVFLD